MKITFLGAVGEVTGSRYLIEHENTKILVDCGLFQGPKEITKRNLESFPVDPKTINALVLTHAHIDHTGYIPALVKNGFKGKIYCSKGTYALATLLLLDSGRLQENEVKDLNRRGGPDRPPAIALYTESDAQNSLQFFKPIDYDTPITIGTSLTVTLVFSGHILGSSFVIVSDGKQKLTFSGDLGRPDQLILKSPTHLTQTDFLVIESTYGSRLHEQGDPMQDLAQAVHETVAKGGVLVIPSFAVEREQTIMYCLYELKQRKAIPDIPIYLDSPLAIGVNALLCAFKDEYNLPGSLCKDIFAIATNTPTKEESKKIDQIKHPAIIVAGSGMADGGRVMFHLQKFISDPKNTVVFVGYQAEGTPGHALVNGAKAVKFNGLEYPVHADIKTIDIFSAHADYNEILDWLSHFQKSPKKTFVTHGEVESAQSLKTKIEERFGWTVITPNYLESFDLD